MSISYKLTLEIGNPTDEGKMLDFTKETDAINMAADYFNREAMGRKKITDIFVGPNYLIVTLEFKNHKGDGVTARDLVKFSQFLATNQGWAARYSRDPGKLFRLVGKPYRDVDDVYEVDESGQYQLNVLPTVSGLSETTDEVEVMTDKEALDAFEALINTKNIGVSSDKKKEAIRQIKKVLYKNI